MAIATEQRVLSDDILARCAERAPIYDRENRFFTEDFEELRRAGYLHMDVPEELGGMGMSLAQVCPEQRRLAYHAAPTALAVNMHLYWTGVAADLWRAGDKSLEWLLKGAVAGEVFAAGHAETGNDLPLLYSTTKAERVAGGYRFTGHKSFGNLSPVWTYLGIHGMDTSDPQAPKIVHAFMPRNTQGYTIKDTWDVLGMRATRSDDTVLAGAVVPDQYIARVVATGAAGIDLFVLASLPGPSQCSEISTMPLPNAPLPGQLRTSRKKRRSRCRVPWPTTQKSSMSSRTWHSNWRRLAHTSIG